MRRGNQRVSGYAQRLGFATNSHGPATAHGATARRRRAMSATVATPAPPRRKGRVTAHPAPWRSRIVGSGDEAHDQLLANPATGASIRRLTRNALAGALDQVGWVQQVLDNQRSGFVVDGHARVALALSRGVALRGEASVPVQFHPACELRATPGK